MLVDFIGAHWNEIKGVLGPQLAAWFTRPPEEVQFFTVLSTVAPQYPSVESDLKSLLSSNAALARTAAGLSFIAKTSPRSPLLLEHCLSVLTDRNPNYNWVEHVETAASLVAEHFSNRDDVGKQLVDLMNQFRQVGPLIAVCLGWPSAPILDELYANFTDPRFRPLSELAESYVIHTKSGPREFQSRLAESSAIAKPSGKSLMRTTRCAIVYH